MFVTLYDEGIVLGPFNESEAENVVNFALSLLMAGYDVEVSDDAATLPDGWPIIDLA